MTNRKVGLNLWTAPFRLLIGVACGYQFYFAFTGQSTTVGLPWWGATLAYLCCAAGVMYGLNSFIFVLLRLFFSGQVERKQKDGAAEESADRLNLKITTLIILVPGFLYLFANISLKMVSILNARPASESFALIGAGIFLGIIFMRRNQY